MTRSILSIWQETGFIVCIDNMLYKIRIDGTERTKLSDDKIMSREYDPPKIAVCGDWVFFDFYDYDNHILRLKRVLTDWYRAGGAVR